MSQQTDDTPNEGRNDYNEPFKLAKQRVEIVERVMKLPYIKATRDTERGEERFVCRDDVITAIHNYAKIARSAPTPPPTAAPEPPQPYVYMCPRLCGCLWSDNHDGTMSLFGVKSQSCNVCEYLPLDKLIPLYKAALPRPHRIGVWDYQSLCDCLRHNLERAIPGYSYRDPQDAIQTLAARVMTLQRYLDAQTPPRSRGFRKGE